MQYVKDQGSAHAEFYLKDSKIEYDPKEDQPITP